MEIIFEDEYVLALNKPNGLLVHHSHYARNVEGDSLMELLESSFGKLHLIHRLDRKTSGIVLVAKSKEALVKFQELFMTNNIQKAYYAVVRGFAPKTGKVDTPIRIDETDIYKDALTYYSCLETIELDIPVHPYPKSRYSLLELIPKTGRMHQLRKHMNKISHPIIGDYKHGDRFHNRNFEQNFNWHTMFLHAASLDFAHPYSNQNIELKADFPENWNQLFQEFNWKKPI